MLKFLSTKKARLIGNKDGQSLVEVLITIGIFSITISAVVLMFFGGHSIVGNSLVREKALQKAHDGAEGLRVIRDRKWLTLTDGMHGIVLMASGSWTLSDTDFDAGEGFSRTVSISTDELGIKHTDITVSWVNNIRGVETVDLSITLAPPYQGIAGDWGKPCVIGSANGDPGSKGTDVFYSSLKAYVTSSEESVGKPDFYIFDVSNPRNPTKLSSLNIEEGLKSVSVRGNYAYVVEENSPDFFVIDISNSSAPTRIAKLTLPGGNGRYVFAYGNNVYVGTTLSLGRSEFFEINVSVPTIPFVARSMSIGADVNEVSVLLGIAYLATSSDTQEIKLIDLASFTQIGGFDLPYYADAVSIHAKSKTRIYVGRKNGVAPDEKEFFILDALDPANIVTRGSYDSGSDIYHSLTTASTLTFIGTDNPNSEFQVLYIRDPSAIQYYGGLNLPNMGTGTDYYNNIVYMSVRNVDILKLISSYINGVCGGAI